MENKSMKLLPYINYCPSTNNYVAYIPYKTLNDEIHEIGFNTYLISKYLNLPTDRENYNPSYTYCYDEFNYEIGICGTDLDKIYEAIRGIQLKLKNKNCEIDDNLSKIEIKIENIC